MSEINHFTQQQSYARPIKAVTVAAVLLSLSACAATGKTTQASKQLPPQINYAPAIDVSYEEVVNRLEGHIGVNVRWGGQIIGSENVNGLNRLTLIAYPLNTQGRPDRKASKDFAAGRFIVETKDFDANEENRFLTVYGPITGEQVLRNGKLQKVIPVVTAIESKEWSSADRKYIARTGRHHPYNGLGYRHGIGFGHGFYVSSRSGFFSHYPYRYRSGFRGSSFRHGFRIGHRGRHY